MTRATVARGAVFRVVVRDTPSLVVLTGGVVTPGVATQGSAIQRSSDPKGRQPWQLHLDLHLHLHLRQLDLDLDLRQLRH